jgi:hypothetical protein
MMLAAFGNGLTIPNGTAAAISVAILAPSILASSRFVQASGFREARRGMGSAYPLPLRHVRLYPLPEYQGTPRRADYRGVGWIPGDNYVETAGIGVAASLLAAVGLFSRRRHASSCGQTLAAGRDPLCRQVGLVQWDLFRFSTSPSSRSKILIILALAVPPLRDRGAELAANSFLRLRALR